MSKRCLGIAAVVALACLGTGARTRVVDGKVVLAKQAFAPKDMIEVRALRFYDCKLAKTGGACTVVSGHIISHLPKQFFEITVVVTLYRICGTGVEIMGSAAAIITEPAPEKRVRFHALGPPCLSAALAQNGGITGYSLAVTVIPRNPGQ